jgi:cold shock CspA family protein
MREELSPLEFGKVKWYRIDKQYGFITRENGEEIFMHHAAIVYVENGNCDHARGICARAVGLIQEKEHISLVSPPKIVQSTIVDQRVTFRVAGTPRGPEARSIKRA